MSQTPIYSLEEMIQGQAHPYILFNEAIRRLEVMASKVAFDFENAPPGTPDDGDVVIVGTGSGLFAGQDGRIAYRAGTSWRFVTPRDGELWRVAAGFWRHVLDSNGDSTWIEVDIIDAS